MSISLGGDPFSYATAFTSFSWLITFGFDLRNIHTNYSITGSSGYRFAEGDIAPPGKRYPVTTLLTNCLGAMEYMKRKKVVEITPFGSGYLTIIANLAYGSFYSYTALESIKDMQVAYQIKKIENGVLPENTELGQKKLIRSFLLSVSYVTAVAVAIITLIGVSTGVVFSTSLVSTLLLVSNSSNILARLYEKKTFPKFHHAQLANVTAVNNHRLSFEIC